MFYYTDNFQTQTDNTKSVIVNHSIHDLSELFELFRVSLQIPYTTMTNFPAFRDVMEELNWLQEDEIRIYHDSLPSLDEESLACYLDYLNLIDVEWEKYEERAGITREYMNRTKQVISADAWINNPPKRFNVYFKKEDEEIVTRLLKKYSKDFRKIICYNEKGEDYWREDGSCLNETGSEADHGTTTNRFTNHSLKGVFKEIIAKFLTKCL